MRSAIIFEKANSPQKIETNSIKFFCQRCVSKPIHPKFDLSKKTLKQIVKVTIAWPRPHTIMIFLRIENRDSLWTEAEFYDWFFWRNWYSLDRIRTSRFGKLVKKNFFIAQRDQKKWGHREEINLFISKNLLRILLIEKLLFSN